MAFTRKMLKALNIDENAIEQIMDAHLEVVDSLKAYKDDAEKLPNVQKELDDLKKENWKQKYEDEHSSFESYKTSQNEKEKNTAKETAFRKLISEAGISDKRVETVLKATGIKDITLDDDGNIKDGENLKKTIRDSWSEFVVQNSTGGASTPSAGGNGGTMTKADIMKIKDSHERQKAIAEHHELFGI